MLTPHEGDARFSGVRVTPDGRSVYLATDRDGDFMRLARLDLSTLELTYLTPDDWDVEEVELSGDGRYLLASRNVEGYSNLVLFSGEGRMPDVRVPEGVVGGFEFAPDSGRLAFTLVGPTRNPDVWVLDLPEGEPRPVTRSSTAGIPRSSFRQPRPLRYPSFDGRDPRPPTSPRERTPRNSERARRAGEPVAADLRPRDAIPLASRLRRPLPQRARLHRLRQGLHPPRRRRAQDGPARDLAHAAHWLRGRGHKRALRSWAAPTAGSWCSPPSPSTRALERRGGHRRHRQPRHLPREHRQLPPRLREPEYGSLERDRQFLESISPIHKAGNIRAPLMVIHGKNDPAFP